MDKRVFNFAAATLPVSVLFFSIIFASATFRQDGNSFATADGKGSMHLLGSMQETNRMEILGMYMLNQLRTAGSSKPVPLHIEKSSPKPRSPKPRASKLRSSRLAVRPSAARKAVNSVARKAANKARIKPASAQALWRRLHKQDMFIWPVNPASFWISSYFGPRTLKGHKEFHQGIDMAACQGTPVIAAADGYVKEAQFSQGYGNYILLIHPKTFKTRYAHLSRICVQRGQRVKAGQLIGRVGATGRVAKSKWGTSASHLHFEVYERGSRVNPFKFLA